MSVNRGKPHILVLPEDRANSEIANGFTLNDRLDINLIQVLPYVRGWKTVVDKFTNKYVSTMRQYQHTNILLLIDFDDRIDRLDYIKQKIPQDLMHRVFILGVLSEPEKLKKHLQMDFESIGESLSTDCSENTYLLWKHDLLKHNKAELDRMIDSV